MNTFLKRLREPSTMAGLSGLALLVGASVDQVQAIANAVAGVVGLLAVFMPEKGRNA